MGPTLDPGSASFPGCHDPELRLAGPDAHQPRLRKARVPRPASATESRLDLSASTQDHARSREGSRSPPAPLTCIAPTPHRRDPPTVIPAHHRPALAVDRERQRRTAPRPATSSMCSRRSCSSLVEPRYAAPVELRASSISQVARVELPMGGVTHAGRPRYQQAYGQSIEQVFGQPLLPGGTVRYEKEPLER